MKNVPFRAWTRIFGAALILITSLARADIELPRGSLAGCPFIHEDAYDLSPILESLKTQLQARLDGKAACLQSSQAIYSSLSSMQNFYQQIDPAMKQKIAQGVYGTAIKSLEERKLYLEATGQSGGTEYPYVVSQLTSLQNSDLENQIDMEYATAFTASNNEATYRTQLLGYTSSLINSYTSMARSNPQCVGALGGWNQALSALMGGFSLATGLGVGPTSQLIGATTALVSQFINLLEDSKVRSAYNDLIKLKNKKTLACTYYAIQKSACEYKRAYDISLQVGKLREFARNRFSSDTKGEYERFFVNQGRVNRIANIFRSIAQMGSALTLDQTLLASYLQAKAVDFLRLPLAPVSTDPPDQIKRWLITARAAGVTVSEYKDGFGTPATLQEQLANALSDIEKKKSTIQAVDKILLTNKSFIDARRSLSANFPSAVRDVTEMKNYFTTLQLGSLVPDPDKPTINAAEILLTKLFIFLSIRPDGTIKSTPQYEDSVITAGADIFAELARGAVAQLTTTQSVFALAEKGQDRLTWAFNVIQNAYLNRDTTLNLPVATRFSEFSKQYNSLADVIANYQAFSGSGATFRNDDYTTALRAFRKSFKNQMLNSLDTDYADEYGIASLKGVTKAHLCALYAPTLGQIAEDGFFGHGRRAGGVLADCMENYKTLKLNGLVATEDFKIDYDDECSYVNYQRELQIQNLIAELIKPMNN